MSAGNFFGGQFFGGGFFGALTADTPTQPSGGYPSSAERTRSRKEISDARARVGITDEIARQAIAEVAARQAERLELDKQKQYDELQGELRLRSIEMETQHLEALASEREALIDLEIARRLKDRLARDEEELWLFLQIVAAAV